MTRLGEHSFLSVHNIKTLENLTKTGYMDKVTAQLYSITEASNSVAHVM